MAKSISMNRIRSEMKNAGSNEYLGSFPSKKALCDQYPERVGGGHNKKKDELVGGKVFNDSSYAIIDDEKNPPTQMKYNSKGRWVQVGSSSGGVSSHQLLSDLQGGKSPDEYYHLAKEVYDDLIAKQTDIMYIGDKDSPISWQVTRKNQGLAFSRFEGGIYKEIYVIENSSRTDNYYIDAPEGRLAYVTKDKVNHTLIKSSTDLKGCMVGNTEGRVSIMNDGIFRSYSPIGNPVQVDNTKISEADGKKNAKSIDTYQERLITSDNILMYGVESFFVEQCEEDTRIRTYITDRATGNILGQSCNESSFVNNVSQLVVKGENKLYLSEPLAILKNKDIILNVQFTKPTKIQGMTKALNGAEQFYVRYYATMQALLEENIATEEWVNEQSFAKPQSLQQTLNVNNMMDINTNISLVGAGKFDTFNIQDTTYSFSSQGSITFDSNGYLLRSLNLSTPTPQEPNRFTLELNPSTSPISPKLLTFQVIDVPNEQIDLPKNISFSVLEMDGKTTDVPYEYIINKNVTPMHGIFYLKLDGRQVKNVSMMITKPSRGSAPDLSKMGYMKVISGYSGDVLNLFEKIDEQYKINPSLIKNQFVDIPDSSNIKPADEKKITSDSIYHLAEDVVGKVEALPIDQRFDILKMKNVDTLATGVFKGVMSSLDVLKDAKKGDYWKNTTTSKITLSGIDFNTNDELFCISTIIGIPTDLSKFQKVPFVSDRVQSNWNQTDSGSPEFIKNKPTDLVTEANSDAKVYGRKNKTWIPLTDIQEPLDTFSYLRTLGKWVKHVDKFNLCAFGDKQDYLKDEFASYNGKLYRALKDTFRSPDYIYQSKVDTGVPQTLPYPSQTSAEYPQIQLLVPFISNSNQTITGFRLNIETTTPIENSYVCLMERVMSSTGSVAKVLTMEKFTANNGDIEYTLKTPFSVTKYKNYELFVLLPSAITFKVMGSKMSVLENSIFKVGLIENSPYSTAFDQRKLGDTSVPYIGSEYRMHQGTWSSGIMSLTPIIAMTDVKDWCEVVGGGDGGEVNWKDIIDKPDDILTDTILAETNRIHLTMDSQGQGLMASTDVPELPKIGLTRYDIPTKRVVAGNKYSDTVIQAGKRILSRVTSVGDTLFSNVGSTQVLSKPEFIIPFMPISTTIIPNEFSIAVEKESTITLIVGDIEVLSAYKLSVGKNNITLPLTEIPCKVGQKIDVVIQAGDIDNPCFMGEIVGEGETKEEKLFYSFSYEVYKDGVVLTSDLANRRLLLTPDAKIQIPNRYGNTLDIISLDGDMSFIGNMQGRMAILGKEKPFMGYAEDSFSLLSIDTEDTLPAKSYSATFKLKRKDEEYSVDSINLTITKPSMVRASVNGIEYGDYRQPMSVGEITLKPVGSRMAMVSGEFNVDIVSAVSGVFIGNVSETPQIPKLTVNLHKPIISRVASELYAHNVNVDKMNESENLRENYRVTGNVQQFGVQFSPDAIQYTIPPRCTPPRLDYRNQRDICFDGDYKMIVNDTTSEEFIVKFPSFKTGYAKTRIEAYLDVYKQEGFIADMVAETEETPKLFKANSSMGKDLKEKHNTVFCSTKNIEYHSFFDYYDGDEISFSFGKNVDFSNCFMVIDIHTISEDNGSKVNTYEVELLDALGKINPRTIQTGEFVDRNEYQTTLRRIDTLNGDNIYLNKTYVSTVFNPLEPQRSDSIFYQVAPNSKVLLPTLGAKNEYVATNLEACTIVGEDYLKFVIRNFGGVQIENQDILKMIVRIYKLNRDTPIKYNLNSILLTTTEDIKLDYECVNNEYKDYYEIEYRVNGAPSDQFVMKVGDGNDWTNLSVVLFFAGLNTSKEEIQMFNKSLKINPELYDGWDSKIDLTNGENITLLTPNEEVWKNIDLNTIKVESSNIEQKPELRNDSSGIYIYYHPETKLQSAGQMLQYTIPVPKEVQNKWIDIELRFDETRDNRPHINPNDFYIVSSGDSEKTVRQEDMTTILTIKSVPTSADGTPIIIRGVSHPSSNNGTDISACVTRVITFKTNGNRPKEIQMFVDNKINKELYDNSGSGWDMKVDMTKNQNVSIIKNSPTTKYEEFHKIPYDKTQEWTPDTYIDFEDIVPHEDLSKCTHFTIEAKGIVTPHYTDNQILFRLIVRNEDGSNYFMDGSACTEAPKLYNKITKPIPAKTSIKLTANCLRDIFGYLPNDSFVITFYIANGSEITVPLLDVKTGLINEDMLPQGNSGGNKFNEIEMYDTTPVNPEEKSKSATISYDSKNLGKLTALKLSSGEGMGVEIGGLTSEISMFTKAKDGISTLYIENESLMEIGGGTQKPVVGNEWLLPFEITEKSGLNVILGIVLVTIGKAKIHAKLTKVKDGAVLVDSDFLSSVDNTKPDQARFIFNPDKQGGTYLDFGKYELVLTSIEGTLIGDDALPRCIAYIGKRIEDKLVLGSAVMNQIDVKTDKRSFIVGEGADVNVLVQYVDYASGYTAMSLTIPAYSSIGRNITVIGDGVLTSEVIGNRDVYVDANIDEIRGSSNFRDKGGMQLAKIFINPNNRTTWDTFVNNGYAVTPTGIPSPTIIEQDDTALVFRKGKLMWEDKPVVDGALYLRPENRIRAIDGGFVFEIKDAETWIQISEITR